MKLLANISVVDKPSLSGVKKMIKKALNFLYFLCLVNFGQTGNTFQFDFTQSSVKVVVQDVFGLVEYKVVKGTND